MAMSIIKTRSSTSPVLRENFDLNWYMPVPTVAPLGQVYSEPVYWGRLCNLTQKSGGHAVGQSIIITGASSGIGEALPHEMARRGYRVGMTARRVDQLQSIRTAILAHTSGAKIEVRALDVCDYGRVEP